MGDTVKALIGHGSFVRYWDIGWYSEEFRKPPDAVSTDGYQIDTSKELLWETLDSVVVLSTPSQPILKTLTLSTEYYVGRNMSLLKRNREGRS